MVSLKEIYEDASTGFVSKDKLKKILKKRGIKVSNKELDEFYKNNALTQQNQKIRVKRYKKITGPIHSYQIDVMVMPARLKSANKGYVKLLVCVDILSRKAYAYPLKNNKMESILDSYAEFLEDADEVVVVQGDNEFNNKKFKDYNEFKNIIVMTDVAKDDHMTNKGNKLGVVDAFVKTLKRRIRLYMEAYDTNKYVDALEDLLEGYNNTPHSSLPKDATPNEASKDKAILTEIKNTNAKVNEEVEKDIKVKVGDDVRLAEIKGTFEKEKGTFSKKIYKVEERIGNRFKIEGKRRLYKPYELLVVDKENVIGNVEVKNIERNKKKYNEKNALEKEGVSGKNVVRGSRRKRVG
jgi:hypothetical protein